MKKIFTTTFALVLGVSVMSFTGCAGDQGEAPKAPATSADDSHSESEEAAGSGNAAPEAETVTESSGGSGAK